jgi:hypothetical protein
MAIGFLLSGCAVQAKPRGIALSITYVNYQSGADVDVKESYTDHGSTFPNPGILRPSSNPRLGATMGGPGREPGLPEWVEFKWKAYDMAKRLPSEVWVTLDAAAKDARMQERAALPVKSARVAVRSLVPAEVIEELEQSPLDPEHPYLRLKSLELYFVWTRDGLKVRWEARQGCCTVLHEGGDGPRA